MHHFFQLIILSSQLTVVFNYHCVVLFHSSVRTGEIALFFLRFIGLAHVFLPLFLFLFECFQGRVFLVEFSSENLHFSLFLLDFLLIFGGFAFLAVSGGQFVLSFLQDLVLSFELSFVLLFEFQLVSFEFDHFRVFGLISDQKLIVLFLEFVVVFPYDFQFFFEPVRFGFLG